MNSNSRFFTNKFSEEIWHQTYQDYNDKDVSDNWKRIAENNASAEKEKSFWFDKFYNIIEDFKFVPAGRIYSNAGTEWGGTTYINCFVSDRNKYDIDSLDGILSVLRDQSQTLKSEGGWGCNFSFIRPRGSFIKGIGVESPGAVKYMELFDKSSDIITSGSGTKPKNKKAKKKIRKGAMMGVLDIWHPDIEEFITAKQSEGVLSKFNISVGCYNDFMDRVVRISEIDKILGDKSDNVSKDHANLIVERIELDKWNLIFPDTSFEKYKEEWYGDIYDWNMKGYPTIVHKTVSVEYLWNLVMTSTYNRNDPGVLFLDIANKTHCWNYGERKLSRILTTNPCGEQTLPNAGCCNLGSLNLVKYLKDDYTGFDLEKIKEDVKVAVRFLDNINTISNAPLQAYKNNLIARRRIGLGVMGWGSSLFLLKTRYGSEIAEKIKEELIQSIVYTAIDYSVDLAIEKGAFEGCDKEKHADHDYFKQINLPEYITERIRKYGIRNSSMFSIQPTGNTGILANNVSGGLEPLFLPEYIRTSIVSNIPEHILSKCPKFWEGKFHETEMFKWTKEGEDNILSGKDEYGTTYKIDKNRGLTVETICEDYAVMVLKSLGEWNSQADWASTTVQLSAQEHITDMKGWAKYIDSAISKTLNIPNNYSYTDFKNIYLECYKTGYIKGFTTYRAGTMASVLSSTTKDEDDSKLKIKKTSAPKRPKKLDCDVFHPSYKGSKFYCVVGKLDGDPYEIFIGEDSEGFIPNSITTGECVKVARGKYILKSSEGKEFELTNGHSDENIFALTRMISTALRHGTPIEFVCDQLNKTTGDFQSFARVLARTLKQYIKDGSKVSGDECYNCGSKNLIYKEGCKTCADCGNSICG